MYLITNSRSFTLAGAPNSAGLMPVELLAELTLSECGPPSTVFSRMSDGRTIPYIPVRVIALNSDPSYTKSLTCSSRSDVVTKARFKSL